MLVNKIIDSNKGDSDSLDWNSLDPNVSVDDKIFIFEQYYSNTKLRESNDEDKKDFFLSLIELSDDPIPNQNYIVAPLILMGNRVIKLDSPGNMKYLGKSKDNNLRFQNNDSIVNYPSRVIRDLSISHVFTFSTVESYDKLRSALILKFNVTLPDMEN